MKIERRTITRSREGEARTLTDRPSWDEYFMRITFLVAERSTCLRRQMGALLVKDKHIIATGYNGAPSGVKHCIETGCLRDAMNIPSGERHELCRALHAEQNAICQAARLGVSIAGATVYTRMTPCRTCAMLLINCGIKRVVCERRYHRGTESEEMFAKAGIELEFMFDEVQEYPSSG